MIFKQNDQTKNLFQAVIEKMVVFGLAMSVALILITYWGVEPAVKAQNRPASYSDNSAKKSDEPRSSVANKDESKMTEVDKGIVDDRDSKQIGQMQRPNVFPEAAMPVSSSTRDPFLPPSRILDIEKQMGHAVANKNDFLIDDKIEAIRRWPISDYKVVGIIWNVQSPKALIVDRNNSLHMLKKGYRVGNREGIITAINEGEVIIKEKGIPVILKLESKTQ